MTTILLYTVNSIYMCTVAKVEIWFVHHSWYNLELTITVTLWLDWTKGPWIAR